MAKQKTPKQLASGAKNWKDWADQAAEDMERVCLYVAAERNELTGEDVRIWWGGQGNERTIAELLMELTMRQPQIYDVLLAALRYTRRARKDQACTQESNDV